jgi:hypothetical protein
MNKIYFIPVERSYSDSHWLLDSIELNKETISEITFVEHENRKVIKIITRENYFIYSENYKQFSSRALIQKIAKFKAYIKISLNIQKVKPQRRLKNLIYLENRFFLNYQYFYNLLIDQNKFNNQNNLYILNWEPNLIEKFMMTNLQYVTLPFVNETKSSYPNIPDQILEIAKTLDLEIYRCIKVNDSRLKLVPEERFMNQNSEITINKFFVFSDEVYFDDVYNEQTELQEFFQNQRDVIYVPYLIGEKFDFDIYKVAKLLRSKIRLVTNSKVKDFVTKIKISTNLIDLEQLDIFFSQVRFTPKLFAEYFSNECIQFRLKGENYLIFHLCGSISCNNYKLLDLGTVNHLLKSENVFTDILNLNIDSRKKNKRICLVLPPPNLNSGGIFALHKLKFLLLQKGYDVRTLPYHPTGRFPNSCPNRNLFKPGEDWNYGDAIWIYSDTVSSLPCDPDVQIQWWLNKPGNLPPTNLGSFRIRPKHIWKYSDVISEAPINKLFISNFNFDLFHPTNVYKREFKSLYIGKCNGTNSQKFSHYLDEVDFIISRTFPVTKKLPHLLASSNLLISLDSLSALNLEANLCGTPTLLIINEDSQFNETDLRRFELPTNGMITNLNDLENIPSLDKDYFDNFKKKAESFEKETFENFVNFLDSI